MLTEMTSGARYEPVHRPAPPHQPNPPSTTVTGVSAARGSTSARAGGNLLALDAEPQHVLPVSHVRVLLHKVHVRGQQELPASVHPGSCHLLQEVLHVLWWKLTRGRR